jgi:hypothetical protein
MVVRVGNSEYRLPLAANCLVCISEQRGDIEAALLNGATYKAIHESLETGRGRVPTMADIANHVRSKHMAAPHLTQRVLLEKRAADVGRSIEEGIDVLVDHVVTTDAIIQRGWEMMQAGELTPTMSDLLSALRLRSSWEEAAGGDIDTAMWQQAMMELLELVRRFMPVDAWANFSKEFSKSAILKALAKEREKSVKGELTDG